MLVQRKSVSIMTEVPRCITMHNVSCSQTGFPSYVVWVMTHKAVLYYACGFGEQGMHMVCLGIGLLYKNIKT